MIIIIIYPSFSLVSAAGISTYPTQCTLQDNFPPAASSSGRCNTVPLSSHHSDSGPGTSATLPGHPQVIPASYFYTVQILKGCKTMVSGVFVSFFSTAASIGMFFVVIFSSLRTFLPFPYLNFDALGDFHCPLS